MAEITVRVDQDLEDLIPIFIENRFNDIEGLKQLVHHKKYKEIQLLGHSMKGFGAGYGFQQISEIGIQLQAAAKNQDVAAIEFLIVDFENYMNNLKIVFE